MEQRRPGLVAMKNKLVFVSYAHTDRKFLDEELMPFLRQLELGDNRGFPEAAVFSIAEDPL